MKKFIAERGLIIPLADLYEDVQSVLIDNLISYIKSIIYEPGLRIAEGDEFLVQQDGANIIADTGAIVFPNYDLWVPPTTGTQLTADISSLEVDAEENKHLAIYVTLETEETHPQRQTLNPDLFYTVQRNVVKMVVCETVTVPPLQSFLLAYAILTPEHELILEDRRFDSVLKLISRYDVSEWEPRIAVLPPVSDVTVSVIRSSDYKQSFCKGQPINAQSLPTDQLGGYYLNVSWAAPTLQEIESLHGVVYYKVVATPVTSGSVENEDVNASQIVLVSKGEIESKSISQRVGCMIPCDLGIKYNVRVYRVSNMLNLRIENATDPIPQIVGPGISPPPENMEISIDYAYSTRDIVSIQCAYDENLGDTMRVYAREYAGSQHSAQDVYQWKYLIYEGPVGETFFKTIDLSNNGLSVYVGIIGKHKSFITSNLEHFGYDEYKTPWENIYSVVVQEAGGGWAGRPVSAPFVAGAAWTADGTYVKVVAPSGHNRRVGDQLYVSVTSDVVTLPLGWTKVMAIEDTFVYLNQAGAGGSPGTCTIPGNTKFIDGKPVCVDFDPNSHFVDKFMRGQEVIVSNTSNAGILANGSYRVRDVPDVYWNYAVPYDVHMFMIDHDGTIGGGNAYGDITFPTSNTVHSFELKNDVYISRIVTGLRGGVSVGDDGAPACIMTVTDGVTPHIINVPKSGVNLHNYDLDYIIAGTSIDIKLERNSSDDRFNLSSLIVFIYLKYRL